MKLERNGSQNVRSDLSANREVIRGKSQKRINFGIYRLLTPESTIDLIDMVSGVLGDTLPGITAERRRRCLRTGTFAINSVMASTFVPRNAVGRNSLQLIANGFNMAEDLRRMREDITPYNVDLAAPINAGQVHWDDHSGGSGRKLVVELDKSSAAFAQLREEADVIQSSLPGIKVRTPDHVTLGAYGQANDGRMLPRLDKKRIASDVATVLDTSGPFYAHYGPVLVGKSYSEALVEWDQSEKAVAAIITLEGLRQAHNNLRLVA